MFPVLILVLCVILRVVPHPPNFAPVGASAVFAGRTLKPWAAILLVGVSMFIGDIVLGRMHGYAAFSAVTPFVYGGFFIQAMLGRLLRARKGGALVAAGGGALVFFATSNFGVWVASDLYPHTTAGLVGCYVAALPFLGGTLLGDVLWTLVLSITYRPLAARLEPNARWVPVPTKELAPL